MTMTSTIVKIEKASGAAWIGDRAGRRNLYIKTVTFTARSLARAPDLYTASHFRAASTTLEHSPPAKKLTTTGLRRCDR